jgi:hypothetical protein
MSHKSSTETLIAAMRILARDIQSGDGVANAAIAEAADRLEALSGMVFRLAELMRRSDMDEFTEDLKPVTAEEWFSALNESDVLLGAK